MPMLFDRLLDLPSVDYLEGAAAGGGDYYTHRSRLAPQANDEGQDEESGAGSAIAAASTAGLLAAPAAKQTFLRHPAATPHDGIRSLTAARTGTPVATGKTATAASSKATAASSKKAVVKKARGKTVAVKTVTAKKATAKKPVPSKAVAKKAAPVSKKSTAHKAVAAKPASKAAPKATTGKHKAPVKHAVHKPHVQ